MDRVICRRCHALMHPIDPLDPLDLIQGVPLEDIRAWRCVTCGDLIDQVIMQNRRRPRSQRGLRQKSTPRQPVFKDPEWEWPVWK